MEGLLVATNGDSERQDTLQGSLLQLQRNGEKGARLVRSPPTAIHLPRKARNRERICSSMHVWCNVPAKNHMKRVEWLCVHGCNDNLRWQSPSRMCCECFACLRQSWRNGVICLRYAVTLVLGLPRWSRHFASSCIEALRRVCSPLVPVVLFSKPGCLNAHSLRLHYHPCSQRGRYATFGSSNDAIRR